MGGGEDRVSGDGGGGGGGGGWNKMRGGWGRGERRICLVYHVMSLVCRRMTPDLQPVGPSLRSCVCMLTVQ